jgi:hypothetical protein
VHEPAATGVTVSVAPETDGEATPLQPVAAYGATPPEIVTGAGDAAGLVKPTLAGERTMVGDVLTVT